MDLVCQQVGLACSPDGQAKIGGSDGAVLILGQEEEVVGLDVPVDDAFGVAL